MVGRSYVKPVPALVIGVIGVVLATLVMLPVRDHVGRTGPALLLLVPVLVAGILGGRLIAGVVALLAAFVYASAFLPPLGSPRVELTADIIALVLFAGVAIVVGGLVATVVASDRRRLSAEEDRNRALRQVDTDRATLLRSVSHDLRTPLATIRAAATDLRGFDHPQATREELLDLVIDESERLDRIVGNLLSLSRIEAGALLPERQPVDIGELVAACAQRLRRVTVHVRLEQRIEPDLPLVALDYSQFDQVVANLLENAVRHSPPGGTVVVAVSRPGAGSRVRVEVIDQGPGFDPSVRERLFEPFASATGSGSSGIGLAICRAIVEAHGGSIAVSEPATGATITVEVPIDG